MKQDFLFDEIKEVEQKKDDTEIVQVLLYYSKDEAKDFKNLCKAGMKAEINDFIGSNISDFLLTILKKYYGKADS